MRRVYFTLAFALVALLASAAAPNSSGTYYQNANGKKGAALKTALCGIIYNRTEKSYEYLWTAFRTTDKRSDGKVWDMYSNITNFEFGTDQAGSYSQEGDVYNREHSFPKSWFGGKVMPMYTDLHHMYPTDGFVNNKRSNYPFGTTTGNKYKSANDFSKLGTCTYPGYTGIVFEPNDEYKGDFARTYFYMITCYEEKLADWYAGNADGVRATIDGSTYPGFQTWQLNMLLKWAKDDRVSDKEIARNTAVAGIQGNRNPFIDYPGLEQYIWGSKVDDTFSYDNYTEPTTYTGYNGGGSGGDDPEPGTGTYKLQQVTSVEAGGMYVFEQDGYVMNNTCSSNALQTTSTYNTTGLTGTETYVWTLETATNGYYMKNANGTGNFPYLNNSSTSLSFGTKSSIWTFNFQTDGTVLIKSNNYRFLGYTTATSHEYKAYATSNLSSYPHAIKVYKLVEEGSDPVDPSFNDLADVNVNYGSTLTLTQGTTGTQNFVTDGTVTLESSNENVVTIDGLKITPVAVGTALITVHTTATSAYNAGSVMFPITVNAPEGKTTAKPSESGLLFGETFGDNTGSARAWNDSYSEKSGVLSVYSGITGYNVTNAKQSKNTVGSDGSGLAQTTQGTDASIIIGPLNVAGYKNLSLTYQWKAGSIKGTYTTKAYYATSATGTYTELTGTGAGATTFVERSYTLPTSAQVSTLYLKIIWNTSNTQGVIDEVQLRSLSEANEIVTLNTCGYASYCSEYPLDFSNVTDFSAWKVTEVSGETITFAQVTGSVKGGTGLLLKGEPGATVTIPSANSTNVLDDNLLEGIQVPTYVELGTYFGLKGNTFVPVAASTVPSGKALLPASLITGSDVKSIVINLEDDPTAISHTPALSSSEGEIYNLAGQRLSELQKGINIVNGKKVLKR